MAAAKHVKKAHVRKAKVRIRRVRPRRHRRFYELSRAERLWRVWNHDLDALMHQAVKNPRLASLSPKHFVARLVAIVDELHATQDERRPPKLSREADGRYF